MKAKISEVFKSIQGEGVYQGIEQVFVRFFGCNLKCRFCDTKLSFYKELTVEQALQEIESFGTGFHSVSLTGGEPLLQVDFLKSLLKELKKRNVIIYLETNGVLYNEFRKIVDYIDIVAMDFKLPSSTGLDDFYLEHTKFLKLGLSKDIFVKAVITKSSELIDLKRTVEILLKFKKNIPLILQPNYFEWDEILKEKIENFKSYCLEYLSDVRVIPQLHKILGIK